MQHFLKIAGKRYGEVRKFKKVRKFKVAVVVFGQATGAIHVSIVDLILPETPCFPFGAFRHSGQMHFLIRYSIYLST